MDAILIVEDDRNIADIIQLTLTGAGYNCTCTYNGAHAADLLAENDYTLVLLDIMLPVYDGYTLMEYIAPMGTPVIFLTAKAALQDKVKGLKMGADDYIIKPFEPEELLARVEAVLRRSGHGIAELTLHGVTLNLNSRAVTQNGQQIALTPHEYELLCVLMRSPGVALYRDALFEQVWGYDSPENTRTLDLHIMRLRQKLSWQNKITTVYKIGYMLEKTE